MLCLPMLHSLSTLLSAHSLTVGGRFTLQDHPFHLDLRACFEYDEAFVAHVRSAYGLGIFPFLPTGRPRPYFNDAMAQLPGLIGGTLDGSLGAEVGPYRWALGGDRMDDVAVFLLPSAECVDVRQRGNHLFAFEGLDLGHAIVSELGRAMEIRCKLPLASSLVHACVPDRCAVVHRTHFPNYHVVVGMSSRLHYHMTGLFSDDDPTAPLLTGVHFAMQTFVSRMLSLERTYETDSSGLTSAIANDGAHSFHHLLLHLLADA
jgi:hypothetical protein